MSRTGVSNPYPTMGEMHQFSTELILILSPNEFLYFPYTFKEHPKKSPFIVFILKGCLKLVVFHKQRHSCPWVVTGIAPKPLQLIGAKLQYQT